MAAAALIAVGATGPVAITTASGRDVSPVHRTHRTHGRRLARRAGGAVMVASGAVSVATVPAWTPFQGPFISPFATPPRPLEWPKIAPYPPGEGDDDGLSRNVDDCNKGRIDGPY